MQERKRLERQPDEAMIAGVAAGVADYFGIDATVVRLLFVGVAIISGGVAVLGYILAAIIMPRADEPAGVGSLKNGVGDLVSRGRELVDETRRAIDQNRGGTRRTSMGTDTMANDAAEREPAPPHQP